MARPTKYKSEYCQQLIDFFPDEPFTIKDMEIKKFDDKGKQIATVDKTEREALPPVFIEDFAIKIGVVRSTINEWDTCGKYPEFSEALKVAKWKEQRQFIVNGSLSLFSAAFSIFTMKNIAGWRDKTETDVNLTANWAEAVKSFIKDKDETKRD